MCNNRTGWLRRGALFLVLLVWCGAALAAGFCVQCGEKLAAEVKFCPDCGHQVGAPLAEKEEAPAVAEALPKEAPEYRSIEEADAYYELAEEERKSVGAFLLPNLKARRYRKALDFYLRILERWPESDKCEHAAYQAARIYESVAFKDYDKAIRYYRTVLAINPESTLDARFQLGRVSEECIRDFQSAAAYYRDCIENARVQDEKEAAADALAELEEEMAKAEERVAQR
ncbi:MAG: tetratricopeptide repeat protein [Planctomycetota bacterium]